MSNRLRSLSNHYKLRCFLCGLKDEICLPVKMFHPHNLIIAYNLAKIQEENLGLTKKTPKWPSYQSHELALLKIPPKLAINRFQTPKTPIPIHKISPQQMQHKRDRSLCHSCETKWHPCHKCQKPKL